MKKYNLLLTALLLTLAACDKDAAPVKKNDFQSRSFTATVEHFNSLTRTSLGTDRTVLWTEGDQLSIWPGTDAQSVYELSDGVGTAAASFTLSGEASEGTAVSANVALYPYTSGATLVESDGTFTLSGVNIPGSQAYSEASFATGAYPMVAVSDDNSLSFKNVEGIVKLTLCGSATIKRILFEGNAGESVSGTASVSVSEEPVLTFSSGAGTTVLLDCGEGVALTSEGVSFYIALTPQTFKSGFTFVVTDSEGNAQIIASSKSQTVKRNVILSMPSVAYSGSKTAYMTFVSQGSSTVALKANGTGVSRTIQYSFDTVNWTDASSDGSFSATVSSDAPLYLRGMNEKGLSGLNSSGTSSPFNDYVYFEFAGDNIECEGDVMTLINYEDVPTKIPNSYCFNYLFSLNDKLVKAPVLGATSLKEGCYNFMFYQSTALKEAPALPATSLVQSCYGYMFYGCTALTEAPSLPATSLANSCYSYMFMGCTSLESAPELPAATLVENCYDVMFNSCSKLNYVKALFTTEPSSTYMNHWLDGVASTGTFVRSNSASWESSLTRSVSTVPEGWTITTE